MTPGLRSVTRLVAVLGAAVFLPACDDSTTSPLPGAQSAQFSITVAPNPVVGTQNLATGVVTAPFTITLTETNGLGGEVQFVNSVIYDPETGVQAAINSYDGDNLVVFVGSKRLEPQGTLLVPQTLNYLLPGARKPATLVASAQLRDDKGNTLYRSLLVDVE